MRSVVVVPADPLDVHAIDPAVADGAAKKEKPAHGFRLPSAREGQWLLPRRRPRTLHRHELAPTHPRRRVRRQHHAERTQPPGAARAAVPVHVVDPPQQLRPRLPVRHTLRRLEPLCPEPTPLHRHPAHRHHLRPESRRRRQYAGRPAHRERAGRSAVDGPTCARRAGRRATRRPPRADGCAARALTPGRGCATPRRAGGSGARDRTSARCRDEARDHVPHRRPCRAHGRTGWW
jgi:hypothetical protein